VDELKEIMGNFNSGATIVGLWGMGGVGKTALALVLAEKLECRFPDGQIFLSLNGLSENPLSPAEAMSKVIRAFRGSVESLPKDQNDLLQLYNSILAGKHVMILLDNAADGKQVEPLLPPKDCVVLITSRKKFSLPGMPEPFLLESLNPSDARDLLLKICHRMGDQAEEIAKLCGYLPLALRATASLLAVKSDLNPLNYLEELRSERTRLEKIGKEGVGLDVEASFNLSYMRLPEETTGVFCQLSVFPSDFDTQAEEFVCQDESHRNLSELVTWSLVEFLQSERYRLHDLARVFAASRLEDAAREPARLRHALHYQKLLWAANELFLQGNDSLATGLKLFDINWMDIKAGQKWASENKSKSNEIAEICCNFSGAGDLLGLRLSPLENIKWIEDALASARQINNRDAEESLLGNLGPAYFHLGEPQKAIECYKLALKISREIGNLRGEGNCLGNLGIAYSHLGNPHKAIEHYELAIKIAHQIGNKWSEGNHLGNLGLAYSHLGEPRRAIEYYELALKIAGEIGDRRGEGNHLDNLGTSYLDLSEFQKAIEYSELALNISREISDSWSEGNRLGNLGLAYYRLGETQKAIEYYDQALKISRDVGDRRGEGNRLGNLGLTYSDLGETRKAIEYYDQALKISREICDLKSEGNHLFNKSSSLHRLNQKAEAIEMAKEALAIFEQIECPYAEIVRKKLAEWGS
jgi:tetratricopeptide (TPR) repeat protein